MISLITFIIIYGIIGYIWYSLEDSMYHTDCIVKTLILEMKDLQDRLKKGIL